ncbi:MAG: hypothetical protein R6X02_19690 [Enhygromyxa sp.]
MHDTTPELLWSRGMDPAAHTRELIERGYTVFERLYEPEWVAALRADIEDIHAELGQPRCYLLGNQELAPGINLCPAGLAVRPLLHMRPRWAADIVRPEVVAALRGALGDDMVLEVAGCVLSDRSRPFFGWHAHVGGIDDGVYRRAGGWPTVSKIQRIMTLTYLQDLDDDNGPMLVYPRRVGEPVVMPHDGDAEAWPGQIELRVPAGSLIALDECTWHAVRPKLDDGLRIFLGLTYASADAPIGGWADEQLGAVADNEHASELLRELVRPSTAAR